jgi:hypothetical protein
LIGGQNSTPPEYALNGMTDYELGRRRVRRFAFGLAAVLVAFGLVTWWTGRVDLREGSRVVSEDGEPMVFQDAPLAYTATYRIDVHAGEETTTNTERVWVNRPFESRVETWRGPPPGTRHTETRQSSFGTLATIPEDARQQPLKLATAPSLSSGDLRIDTLIEAATEDGTIVLRERREVFGRECQVYRTGDTTLAGDIVPHDPDSDEYADVCVDSSGIVLEEAWVRGGELLRRRVAVELEIGASIEESLLEITIGDTPGINPGAIERIPDEDPEVGPPLWTLPEPPEGFESLGRYGVVLSDQALPQDASSFPLQAATSITDVYVRGPDLLVIDQDPSLEPLAELEDRPIRQVDLGDLEGGQLIIDARSNEVRARTPEGSFVRVYGTLPPDEIIALALQLRPTPEDRQPSL